MKRLLFRHRTPHPARASSFYDDFRLEILGTLSRRRRLLSEAESAGVTASALDNVTGIDVLETPSGELNAWLLQALQSHPGEGHKAKSFLLWLLPLSVCYSCVLRSLDTSKSAQA